MLFEQAICFIHQPGRVAKFKSKPQIAREGGEECFEQGRVRAEVGGKLEKHRAKVARRPDRLNGAKE